MVVNTTSVIFSCRAIVLLASDSTLGESGMRRTLERAASETDERAGRRTNERTDGRIGFLLLQLLVRLTKTTIFFSHSPTICMSACMHACMYSAEMNNTPRANDGALSANDVVCLRKNYIFA